MLAQPVIGQSYRQEFFAGVAEDFARVVSLKQSVSDALHVLGTSRPVSLLLNQAAPRIGQGYGYGYGYGYPAPSEGGIRQQGNI